MSQASVVFQFSAPTLLPDGSRWTARFVSEDWFHNLVTHFDVRLQRPDGTTEEFPATIPVTDEDGWDQEPGRAHRDLDRVVRDRVGVRW